MYVSYVRNHFLWSKNFPFGWWITKVGQKRPNFMRGDPYEWCQRYLGAPKCKKKLFFLQTAIPGELSD